jgi:hypothetical protein
MIPFHKFILLDAARIGAEIEKAKDLNTVFDSLYRGESEVKLSSVAPYLFTLNREREFVNWYFEKGWGDSWGVLAYSLEDTKRLIRHFRTLLMVKTESGVDLYFRFYDPRVLRIFLPTCDAKQLEEFFGPVDYYICEDEDPNFGLVFSFSKGILDSLKITKDQAITFEPGQKKKRFSFF